MAIDHTPNYGLPFPDGNEEFNPNTHIEELAQATDGALHNLPADIFADGTYGTLRGTLPAGQKLREWVFYNVGGSAIPFASGGILGLLTPFTGGVVAATIDFLGGPDTAHTDTQLPTKWTIYNTGLGVDGRIIVNYRAWLANNTNPNGYSRQFFAKVVGW